MNKNYSLNEKWICKNPGGVHPPPVILIMWGNELPPPPPETTYGFR